MTGLPNIKEDHQVMRRLIADIIETEPDDKERKQLFEKLKMQIELHAAIEEQVLYAELLSDKKASEKVQHSSREHLEAAHLINQLSEMDCESKQWIPKLKELEQALEHHMEEEENELFQLAESALDKDKLIEIDQKFREKKSLKEEALEPVLMGSKK